MSAQSAIVESSELADTLRVIRAHRKRPEGSGVLQNEPANFGLFREFRDLAIRSASKEKELIEVAHPNLFRFAGGQTSILAEFAGRKRAERNGGDAEIVRKLFESFRCSGLRLRDGNTSEAAQANRVSGFQVEIVLREINAAAALPNERPIMAEAAARLIKLRARQTGQPDTREL